MGRSCIKGAVTKDAVVKARCRAGRNIFNTVFCLNTSLSLLLNTSVPYCPINTAAALMTKKSKNQNPSPLGSSTPCPACCYGRSGGQGTATCPADISPCVLAAGLAAYVWELVLSLWTDANIFCPVGWQENCNFGERRLLLFVNYGKLDLSHLGVYIPTWGKCSQQLIVLDL